MVTNHFELSDQAFSEQFEQQTLDASLFTHEAHLRLAWIQIRNLNIDQAINNVTQQITNYVKSLGASDKYHHTLTVAAVRTVYHFVLKSKSDNFKDFLAEYPRLTDNFKELLNAHYSPEVLHSKEARSSYLEPDLQPYD